MTYAVFWTRLHRSVMVPMVLALVASCAHPRAAGQTGASQLAGGLSAGWNRIDGGPKTICSRGSPYAFFVQPGDPHRLMVFFQGGGACWNAKTCDDKGRNEYFKEAVGARERPSSTGIFDTTRSDNPVREFTKVYVPVCTGDVHLGDRTTTYVVPASNGEGERSFVIHHNGGANVDAALAWTYAHVAAPRLIFVTGESAGSVATPFYAAVLAGHYPKARVVALGDASNAYEPAGKATAAWGVVARLRAEKAFQSVDSTSLSQLGPFRLAAQSAPRIRFAVVNSVDDSTQAFYLRSLDPKSPPVRVLIARHNRELEQSMPDFHSYTYPGWMHTIIGKPGFYTTTVEGVRLRDWVAGLLDGSRVRSVGMEVVPGK